MKLNIAGISGLATTNQTRVVLYQSGQMVHAPLDGLKLAKASDLDESGHLTVSGITNVPFPRGGVGIRPITRYDGRHRSLGAAIMTYGDNKWVLVFRESDQHSQDLSAVTRVCHSYDGGATWSDPVTIYSESGYPLGNKQAGEFANGRIGFLAGRRSAGQNYDNDPIWMWSDDGGETWSSRLLSGTERPSGGWTGAGHQIYRWPASVGGHDETGFIAFSSSKNDPDNTISYLRTADNGETWETGVVIGPIEDVDLSTLAVVRLGETDRWIMLVRPDQQPFPNLENALAFKSTDLVNWTGPYDTGQMNNANPHTAMPWKGGVYWLASARTTGIGSRAIPPLRDGFVHQWADYDRVWDSDCTDWPGWEELCNVSGMEGHPFVFWHNGSPYCLFGYVRNPQVDDSGTLLGLMGAGVIWPTVPQLAAPTRFEFASGWVDRYPDGRQECQLVFPNLGPIEISHTGTFLSDEVDIGDWPLPFHETPDLNFKVLRSSGNVFAWAVTGSAYPSPTNGGKIRLVRTSTSAGTDYDLTVVARGRWYAPATG